MRATKVDPADLEVAVTLRRSPVGLRGDAMWTEAPAGVSVVTSVASVWPDDEGDGGLDPVADTAATLEGYLVDLNVEPSVFWGLITSRPTSPRCHPSRNS